MPKEEVPLLQLRSYLPEGSFEDVQHFLVHYKVHLTVTRKRQTVLGDYRHAHEGKSHRISINGNLNKYSFSSRCCTNWHTCSPMNVSATGFRRMAGNGRMNLVKYLHNFWQKKYSPQR